MTLTARQSTMFSSASDDWATPTEFFLTLDHEFGPFALDACASAENHKAPRYFTRDDDGLSQDWTPGPVFMNPPYGKPIPKWVAKAWHESQLGATVVALVPARTDTAWWHDYIERRAEVRFVRGRLRFGRGEYPAPFPSAVVIWRPETHLRTVQ